MLRVDFLSQAVNLTRLGTTYNSLRPMSLTLTGSNNLSGTAPLRNAGTRVPSRCTGSFKLWTA